MALIKGTSSVWAWRVVEERMKPKPSYQEKVDKLINEARGCLGRKEMDKYKSIMGKVDLLEESIKSKQSDVAKTVYNRMETSSYLTEACRQFLISACKVGMEVTNKAGIPDLLRVVTRNIVSYQMHPSKETLVMYGDIPLVGFVTERNIILNVGLPTELPNSPVSSLESSSLILDKDFEEEGK